MKFYLKHRKALLNLAAFALSFCFVGRPDRFFNFGQTIFDDSSLTTLSAISMPTCAGADENISLRLEEGAKRTLKARVTKGEISRGDTLDVIARRAGVSPNRSQSFTSALRPVLDPRQMRLGDDYTFWTAPDGEVLRFEYQKSPVEIIRGDLSGDSWVVKKVNVPIERVEATISGTLEGSLWNSFIEAGADADLIMAFADLFAWDVDFTHESQPGDQFRAVYERLYVDGKFIGNGRIKAASYKDRDETHFAFYFTGVTTGYYDLKGNNIRKSFLRSPLDFTRVTSNFSSARRHPVTHEVKPHYGVDFGAPTGTPVKAVADGSVSFAGANGGAGKMITLRHAMGYESSYLHLSGYGKGIRSGARVDQGQVIGYVGATGLATGPHLDYRLRINGSWVNPLKHKFEPGPPVAASDRPAFEAGSKEWIAVLDRMPLLGAVAEAKR